LVSLKCLQTKKQIKQSQNSTEKKSKDANSLSMKQDHKSHAQAAAVVDSVAAAVEDAVDSVAAEAAVVAVVEAEADSVAVAAVDAAAAAVVEKAAVAGSNQP
jgi:hypothetical protein